MDFDLYGTSAPKAKPVKTTLQALAAAEWTLLPNGRFQLMWDDHTDYDEPGQGYFVCELYVDESIWIYDYWHSERGGPQILNDLGCDGEYPVEDAKKTVLKAMERMVGDWTTEMEEQIDLQSRYFDDEGDEDFTVDPEAERISRGER